MTENPSEPGPGPDRRRRFALLFSIFLLGACGLIYELVAGAAASYLVGDTVTYYSLVIGAFLASMGVGAWLTQWFRGDLLPTFLVVQLAVGIIGGFSGLLMFAAFAHSSDITFAVLAITTAVGALVGMEIPLVLRIVHREGLLRVRVAQVLTLDYVGALAASVAFPFLVLPLLGLVRAALVFGAVNVLIATLGTALFFRELPRRRRLVVLNAIAWLLILGGLAVAGRATSWLEDRLYQDEIVLAEDTAYQRIVITRWRDDVRLHLNGHLQFSSVDEYRYHESLVLPALAAVRGRGPVRALVLGGGDGLAARRILDDPRVESVDLVDIDGRVVELFRDREFLAALNGESLADPRVRVHTDDAMVFLREAEDRRWDAILMDLPDPGHVATAKLYTTTFFGLALRHLTDRGVLVTQATSPFYAREAFWCVEGTLATAARRLLEARPGSPRHKTVPYHVYVPSFGEWGFVLLAPAGVEPAALEIPDGGRYLTTAVFRQSLVFPPDLARVETQPNELDDPVVVRYYERGWSRFGE